jgi:hypothetical protein
VDEVIMVNGAEHDRPASGRGYLYQLAAGAGWASLPVLPLIRQPRPDPGRRRRPNIPLVNARPMARLLPNGPACTSTPMGPLGC